MRKHCYLEQLPYDPKQPNTITIQPHIDKIAFTDFDNFDDEMNPWNIWLKRLNKMKEEDLKFINSEEYKKSEKSFAYDELFYHQSIHNPMFAAYISAIYSKVENHLKFLLKIDEYTFDNIIESLENKGINYRQLKEINNVNLLRLYNNAYKHNNLCITDELAEVIGTKDKGLINYTTLDIPKFVNSCYEFLWDLEQKLVEIKKQEVAENDL